MSWLGLPVAYAVDTEIAGKRQETAERLAGHGQENGIEDVQAVGIRRRHTGTPGLQGKETGAFYMRKPHLAGRIKELINDKL